jgi:hypothetical protein
MWAPSGRRIQMNREEYNEARQIPSIAKQKKREAPGFPLSLQTLPKPYLDLASDLLEVSARPLSTLAEGAEGAL